MSLFGKIIDRMSGVTAMKKGYSDTEVEIVEAAATGDIEEIMVIVACEDPKKEAVEEEKKDSWKDPWDDKKEGDGW